MLQRYNPILNAMKDLCPTAHIGGGAVRDSLLERPIRDIDLFLDVEATDEAAAAAAVAIRLRQSRRVEVLRDVLRSRRGAGGQVREGRRDHPGLPDRAEPEVRARDARQPRRFDFGICMAGWDGEEVYTAPEYKRDVERRPSRCAVPTTSRSSTTRCRASTR